MTVKNLHKIIQKHLNINELIDLNKETCIKFPNQHLNYEISELENKISGHESFRFDNT